MAKTNPALQMKQLLDEFSKEVQEAMDDSIEEVSKEAVSKLKNTSPNRFGKYARGWAVKREKIARGTSAVVYNKTNWQLTHLLENGHVIKNKYGVQQRRNGGGDSTDSHKHIKPVEEWAIKALPEEIERRLT